MAYEDEDELNKWLSSQSAPNLEAAPTPAPAASGGSPWDRARELMTKQSNMSFTPSKQQEVKAAEAPGRDDWKTVLAMAINLIGNKGKDAGQLMMAGEDQYNKKLARWQDQNNPQALNQQRLQQAQLANMERQGFDADRKVLGDQVSQEMQVAGAQQGQNNADRQFNQSNENHLDAMAEQQGNAMRQEAQFAETGARSDKHFDATQGLTREQMAQAKALADAQRAQSAGQFNATQRQAQTFHEDAQNQHLDDMMTRAGEQHREREADLEKAGIAAREKAAAAERQTKNDLVSQSSGYSNDAAESLAMLPHLKVVNDILDRYKGKKDIPGLGAFDSAIEPGSWTERSLRAERGQQFIDDTIAMRQAIGRGATMDIKKISGANVPETERAILMLQAGAGKMDERTARSAIKQLSAATKADLRGRAANREQAARDVLRGYGMESYLDPDPEPVPLQVGRYSGLRKVQ